MTVEKNHIQIEANWKARLLDQFESGYMADLKSFLLAERAQGRRIYPSAKHWFEAFNQTPFEQVRVVIIGQDPYPGPNQAHGLCFSVRANTTLPPSLRNIFKEVTSDMTAEAGASGQASAQFPASDMTAEAGASGQASAQFPASDMTAKAEASGQASAQFPEGQGDLTGWAAQGVFLLNTVLTVEHGKPNSHAGRGWEMFTDQVVNLLATQRQHLVFMLWGKHAQQKGKQIDRSRHLVLSAPHPSPLSSYRGFFGCRHFSKCNQYLRQCGQADIKWFRLPYCVKNI